VVVVEVQKMAAVAQDARGVAVDVAAVQEHHGAVGDVRRRRLDQAVEREDAVLDRQRQIMRRDEHLRILPERRQQALHADQRAERVTVGILMCGQHEARILADPLEYPLAHDLPALLGARAVAHEAGPSSISASTRRARSVVSS
jgi:hypothetical protein